MFQLHITRHLQMQVQYVFAIKTDSVQCAAADAWSKNVAILALVNQTQNGFIKFYSNTNTSVFCKWSVAASLAAN